MQIAMDKLKYYLLGRHFISCVDHKPLVAMQEGKMNSIMENWMFSQVRYDFMTLYLLGRRITLSMHSIECLKDMMCMLEHVEVMFRERMSF